MVKTIIMQCGHCGNTVSFEEYGEYTEEDTDPKFREYWAVFTYKLFKCQICSNPTLKRTCISSEDDTQLGPFHPPVVLYPIEGKNLDNIPIEIWKTYKEALKVQKASPRACAILIGLTLEAICNQENASGRTLSEKINSLVHSEQFPKTLADMVNQLRKLRNLSAHNAKGIVTEEDVPIVLSLLEAILEYLYVAPAKLGMLKKKLGNIP